MKAKHLIIGFAATSLLTSCLESVEPTSVASQELVAQSESSLEAMVSGLPQKMVATSTYSSSSNGNDWGYPCQMLQRESAGDDFPMYDNSYNYQYYQECNIYMWYLCRYTYYYYYSLINHCNSLINAVGISTISDEVKNQYLGQAYGYRAMAYMDLARYFEFRKTGVAELDALAESLGCMELTVPIVTEKTTENDSKSNPRVSFATMYRFINSDLQKAETLLTGYSRSATEKYYMDQNVIDGLQARLWLEIATRGYKSADDLATILADENANDNWGKLGISSLEECYQKAENYATKAMDGLTPLTESQWKDAATGFNTASNNDSWMWCATVGTKEQLGAFYYSFLGEMTSEPTWSMANYGAHRCIGRDLYDHLSNNDWRKTSWIAPDDAGDYSKHEKYVLNVDEEGYKKLPAYANIKFRPGSGNLTEYKIGLIGDIPLMRMEEMEFIRLEALAHLKGYQTAAAELNDWMNTYRYTNKTYDCLESGNVYGINTFTTELLYQKRAELWGEGQIMWDYKRLAKQVIRKYTGTNYKAGFIMNSKEGYVAPWMNYYIPDYEFNYNTACIKNPDPSNYIKPE